MSVVTRLDRAASAEDVHFHEPSHDLSIIQMPAVLLAQDLLNGTGAASVLFASLQDPAERMLGSFGMCPASHICAGLLMKLRNQLPRHQLSRLQGLLSMLSTQEASTAHQMQEVVMSLTLVAAEASFKLKDGLLCESEVWSTPAVFADLESWRQLLVHTDTLLQSMLEGFTCLTDPRHYAAAILATTETSLQLTQLRVPWVHQPARSLSLMDISRPIRGLDPSSHH